MITINNLLVQYDEHIVLNYLSASFETGQVHGIVGLNGAGKTTFFNTLGGYQRADAGEIRLSGKKPSRSDFAYLETNSFFYASITGREYLAIFPQSNASFRLDSMNSLLGVPLDELIEHYSTGMKKKLALLSVIKRDKPVYIFDEPFNGLDLESNKVLELIIRNLAAKGKTIFISSHILEPLLQVCQQIHYLDHGTFARSYLQPEFGSISGHLFDLLGKEMEEQIGRAV